MINSKQVHLFRHGLATKSLNGYGDNQGVSLLPESKSAVIALATHLATLEVETFLVSPYQRCQETAQVVSEYSGIPFITEPLLGEFYQESWEDFEQRMRKLAKMIDKHSSQKILLGTHGLVIAALSHLLTNRSFTPNDQFDYPPPAGMRTILNEVVTQKIFSVF